MVPGNPFADGSGKRFGLIVIVLAGVSALVASVITVVSVLLQSKNYRKPLLQRYVVRILLMVPIYSIASWTSLISLKVAFWVDPWRDVYEAFTIYTFFQLLINFIGGERALIILMHGRKPVAHLWPLNHCFAKIDISDPYTFLAVKRGILQYAWIKPLLALSTIIMKATDTYQEGYIGVTSGYLWSGLIYNISITISLYALAMFWVCMSDDLKPFRPMPKFVSIKGIIFASYWQGFFLSILVWLQAIPDVEGYTRDNLATSIQDALICFEMPAFAILHWYAFSWHDYADITISAARMPVRYALRDAFGTVDLIEDAKETFTGTQYGYRQFDAGDSMLAHEQSAQREARIRQGMRYERNGKGKYWIPDPHEASSKTPLLGKLTGERRMSRSRSTSKSERSGGYGAAQNGVNELSLDADDEKFYQDARNFEFGDYHQQYPVITAHHATREDRLYSTPGIITAATNRHLLQATTDNRKRRKSSIQQIQKTHGQRGKHRPSASNASVKSTTSSDDDDRGRSNLARIPVIGEALDEAIDKAAQFTHRSKSVKSTKSDRSMLVDLVVEDHEAEEIERVRARKEGSPEWNRHEAKHFVRAYPTEDGEDEEVVRAGNEPDGFHEQGNRTPKEQHTMDQDFVIGEDEEEQRIERVKSEEEQQWSTRKYGNVSEEESADEARVEEGEQENRAKRQGKGKGKKVTYEDMEENVWASPKH